MVKKCCIKRCPSKNRKLNSKVSFHRFPTNDPNLLKRWVEFLGYGLDWTPSRYAAICSLHFCSADFRLNTSIPRLTLNAVPSIKIDSSSLTNADFSQAENSSDRLTNRLCRLCGSEYNSNLKCIFQSDGSCALRIFKCLQLVVARDDILPLSLCSLCDTKLNQCEEFINLVNEAQNELKKKFNIDKEEPEHTDFVNSADSHIKSEHSININDISPMKTVENNSQQNIVNPFPNNLYHTSSISLDANTNIDQTSAINVISKISENNNKIQDSSNHKNLFADINKSTACDITNLNLKNVEVTDEIDNYSSLLKNEPASSVKRIFSDSCKIICGTQFMNSLDTKINDEYSQSEIIDSKKNVNFDSISKEQNSIQNNKPFYIIYSNNPNVISNKKVNCNIIRGHCQNIENNAMKDRKSDEVILSNQDSFNNKVKSKPSVKIIEDYSTIGSSTNIFVPTEKLCSDGKLQDISEFVSMISKEIYNTQKSNIFIKNNKINDNEKFQDTNRQTDIKPTPEINLEQHDEINSCIPSSNNNHKNSQAIERPISHLNQNILKEESNSKLISNNNTKIFETDSHLNKKQCKRKLPVHRPPEKDSKHLTKKRSKFKAANYTANAGLFCCKYCERKFISKCALNNHIKYICTGQPRPIS